MRNLDLSLSFEMKPSVRLLSHGDYPERRSPVNRGKDSLQRAKGMSIYMRIPSSLLQGISLVFKKINENKKRRLNMNTLLITLSVITGVVLISVLGFFGNLRGKESCEEGKERAIEWISSELSLTKEQRLKLVHISDELVRLEKEMKRDREVFKEEAIDMIASDELNQAKILGWIKEKQKQVDEFAAVIIAELADFHKSLNPKQRKKLADELNKHSHENRFGHGFYHGNQ
ncbi:MAG: Spy/CpxP family protein refolding chaperone [Thermodesulfobacteriota bacterium]